MTVARVLLLGLMGSGKTTVGRTLAGGLGWPYLDNDDLVEEFAGKTKARLVEARGELGLRIAEARALRMAMSRTGPFVAGVAAGVVLNADDSAPLKDPPDDVALVWLRVRIDTLVGRLRRDPADRPWLTDELERSLREMAAEREPAFAAFAHVVVDVDGLDPADASAEITRQLELGPAVTGDRTA